MPIVTITRGAHSGGEELAESLAKRLGAKCVSSDILRDAAKTYNVSEEKVSRVFESAPSFWERMTESRRIHVAYVQATLADYAKDDHLVYHGNAGQELLREVPHVLRVRLVYPKSYRIQRIIEQFKCEPEEAKKMVTHIDEERTKRTQYMFSADWRDPTRYDIVFRMEKISPAMAEEMILNLLEQPPFQLDEARQVAFQDFLLKSAIYAVVAHTLVGRLSLVRVTVENGNVTLKGNLTSTDSMVEQLVADVEKIGGVKSVTNEILTGLVYQEWNV